jgi:hypothetical protein
MNQFKSQRDHDLEDAKKEITECEAMKVLLSNNSLAAEIHIAGMRMGTCDNSWLIPIVDKQIEELNKFINGKPNLWE